MKDIPKLKLVKSDVIRCYGCGIWIIRLPQWDNCELGKGWQCLKCGTTAITYHEGRPFGPRSRYWSTLSKEFREYYDMWSDHVDELDWFLSTVKVEIPVT